jgi:hypothetical protein
MLRYKIFLFFLFITSLGFGQKGPEMDFIRSGEDSLVVLFNHLYKKDGPKYVLNDYQKKLVNNKIDSLFSEILLKKESFDYGFPKLKHFMSVLMSKDELVKIYVWDTRNDDYTHTYRGFLQYYHKKKKKVLTYRLNDFSDSIPEPQKARLDYKHWYGNLIYQIVEKKYRGRIYYTLIGWDENNLLTSKKVVDVLYFTGSGRPKFGKRIFVVGRKKYMRLIFEFSAKVAMVLHYDKRYDMIVMDHLSPSKKIYTGLYQFYGPDFTYDGLKFKKGKWYLIENIQVKNPKRKGIKENDKGKPKLPIVR